MLLNAEQSYTCRPRLLFVLCDVVVALHVLQSIQERCQMTKIIVLHLNFKEHLPLSIHKVQRQSASHILTADKFDTVISDNIIM